MTPLAYALLAQEAYNAKPDIGDPDSASRAIVRQTAAGLVIAFPGTDNIDCWGADLDIEPEKVPGVGEVHGGFWGAWQAIADPVMAAIGDQPVTLVGHSLGSAIGICAAISLTLAGKPPIAVWGFEPPRVSPGVDVAGFLINVPMVLYRNGNDIVPLLPPDWQHAGIITPIGKASLPFANVRDHALARVIEALTPSQII